MPNRDGRRDLVVIGGSAGALESLRELLSRLPKDFPAAIAVVIHIPSNYPSYLAEILGRAGPLQVREVRQKEKIRAGTVYVAPPDRHLLIEDGKIEVSRGPRENRHRPAIDPLFRTAARAYGRKVIGVILSGTLDDGSSGLMAVSLVGGIAAVQNRDEALSPEMPSRAKQYAHAQHELPVAELAESLVKWTKEAPEREEPEGEGAVRDIGKEGAKANLKTDANAEKKGKPSAFACPDCGGVLWELEEGELLRFRCRVGHAYTADSLDGALTDAVETALWASMRAMEEKAALLRRVADRSGKKLGEQYRDEAEGFDKHVETVRNLLAANQKLQDEEEGAAD